MYLKKGKVQFGYKDTWSLDSVLSEVILSGLIKFKEVINEGGGGGSRKGVPSNIVSYMEGQGLITQEDYSGLSDECYHKCEKYYDKVLDEMIYAFDDKNEPDLDNYDFTYTCICHEPDENGMIPCDLDCTNDKEKERYDIDMKIHRDRCDKGRELLSKYFDTLWW